MRFPNGDSLQHSPEPPIAGFQGLLCGRGRKREEERKERKGEVREGEAAAFHHFCFTI